MTTRTELKAKLSIYSHFLICVIAIGFIVMVGKAVLCPLFFAILFSFLLLPVVSFFEVKLKVHRGIASMLAVLLLMVIAAIFLYIVYRQCGNIASNWPKLKPQLATSINHLQNFIFTSFHLNSGTQLSYLHNLTDKILDANMVGNTIVGFSSIALFLVLVVFDTFFILFYRGLFQTFLDLIFKGGQSKVAYKILAELQVTMRRYMMGITLEMVIVMAVCCSLFCIIGIQYGILLGILTGIFNIIPYAGIFTALIIDVLVTFATAGAKLKLAWLCLAVVGVHLVDANILLPFIVGGRVRVNAFVTIIGLVVGELVWGIAGIFLCIPFLAILKVIFDQIESLKPVGVLLGKDEQKKPLTAKRAAKTE